MSGNIQCVFFDLGDTLVRIKLDILRALCEKIGRLRRAPLDVNGYMAAFQNEWNNRKNPLDEDLIKGVITPEREISYWQNFFRRLLMDLRVFPEHKALIEGLAKTYSDSQYFECFDDVHPVLAKLKAEGFKLGLISNAFPSAARIIEDLDIEQYFDYTLLSFEFKSVKPEPKIYQFAVEKLDVKIDRTVFVDDRWRFVKAAIELGMKAYLIDRFPNQKEKLVTRSLVPRINDLSELYSMVLGNASGTRNDTSPFGDLREARGGVLQVSENVIL